MKKSLFKSKKAMFFTLLTISVLAIYIFYFSTHNFGRESAKKEVVEKRILSIDDFLNDVKRDLSRGLYVSGYRSLLALNEHMITHNTFIDDVESRMKEGIINGTINSTTSNVLLGSTFPNWMQKISYQGDKIKVSIDMELLDVNVYQKDPWFVTVGANVSFFVYDELETASFNQVDYVESDISIIGFEDPLYIIHGAGRLTNLINKTPFENNFTFEEDNEWNISHLLDHTYKGYYSSNSDAPNFLQRFEEDFAPSENGIESLVNLAKFSSQGLRVYDNSIVDHDYFQNASTTNYRVNETPPWFKLSSDHRANYMVMGLSYLDE